jgi:hypothetical protein
MASRCVIANPAARPEQARPMTWENEMRYIALLPLALVALAGSQAVVADPRPSPAVTCNAGGLTAHPVFNQVSPGRAEYSFSGVCTTREGLYLGYQLVATWTPTEAYPNANASEIYRITTLSGPSQSFDVIFGAHCRADPWLNNAPCKRVGDNLSDELRALWPELGKDLFPYSHGSVPWDQRDALRAEYERANGRFDRSRALSDSASTGKYGTAAHATTQQAGGVQAVIDEVALNPQPLPPEPPDPDGIRPARDTASTADDKGAKAGIIIVGGKPLYRRIDQTTTTSAVGSKAVTP